jgi:hypothetical protein
LLLLLDGVLAVLLLGFFLLIDIFVLVLIVFVELSNVLLLCWRAHILRLVIRDHILIMLFLSAEFEPEFAGRLLSARRLDDLLLLLLLV